jgi:phosphoenolpyruvate synthase/pyruvate phosphate dikinase
MPKTLQAHRFIRWFEQLGIDDIALVGGKNASLGEMYRELAAQGVKVPNGFAVTAENGLEVYVMCEIPSNVILADEFCEVFDGFSIGSNDLTQLILGVDRDSEIVAHVFDERNAAVTQMIARVIRSARHKGRKIGICGQAPSDYPEFAAFLVKHGIDSISLERAGRPVASCRRVCPRLRCESPVTGLTVVLGLAQQRMLCSLDVAGNSLPGLHGGFLQCSSEREA